MAECDVPHMVTPPNWWRNVGGPCYDDTMKQTKIDEALVHQATAMYMTLFEQASTETIVQGAVWYNEAQTIARELAILHHVTIEVAASVIASFSPRNRWAHNVYLATEFLNGNSVATLGNNIRMANRSLIVGFDALKGQKTNAFARNIAGDLNAVTIDTWMIKAAGLDNSKGVNKSQYNALSIAITNVANMYRVPPAIMQAILWITIRGSAS